MADEAINPEEAWSFGACDEHPAPWFTLLYGAVKLAGGKKVAKTMVNLGCLKIVEKKLMVLIPLLVKENKVKHIIGNNNYVEGRSIFQGYH